MPKVCLSSLALLAACSSAAVSAQVPGYNLTNHHEFNDMGSWRKVLDEREIGREARVYQRRLDGMGVVAIVHSCRFVSQIAQGNAGGAIATGALCSISIGRKQKRDFWVCENSMGPFIISDNQEYGPNYKTSEKFTGSACWVL